MGAERISRATPRGRGSLPALIAAHAQAFAAAFGTGGAPRLYFSPGRVNLMGAHLDYNGGPVMPMAVDRGTFLALRERSDRKVLLRSTSEPGEFALELDRLPAGRAGVWSDYPTGVLVELARLGKPGARARGLEVLFGGNLPVGAGLSSSASICVGTAFALDSIWGLSLEPMQRVELALAAERRFVGVQCGVMDPFAVGLARLGHLLWLDCKDRTWQHLPLDHERVRVAVADTLVRRELAQGAFNQRVAEARAAFEHLRPLMPGARCLRDVTLEVLERAAPGMEPLLQRRAEHVLREVQRTLEARAALEGGDVAGFGARMSASHASLRDLYEVSVPELDCLVESALEEPNVLGARLTGAGFGGCVVLLLRREAEADGTLERVAERFRARFARTPTVAVFGGDAGPREVRAGS